MRLRPSTSCIARRTANWASTTLHVQCYLGAPSTTPLIRMTGPSGSMTQPPLGPFPWQIPHVRHPSNFIDQQNNLHFHYQRITVMSNSPYCRNRHKNILVTHSSPSTMRSPQMLKSAPIAFVQPQTKTPTPGLTPPLPLNTHTSTIRATMTPITERLDWWTGFRYNLQSHSTSCPDSGPT